MVLLGLPIAMILLMIVNQLPMAHNFLEMPIQGDSKGMFLMGVFIVLLARCCHDARRDAGPVAMVLLGLPLR
jgi:hypothetical protein